MLIYLIAANGHVQEFVCGDALLGDHISQSAQEKGQVRPTWALGIAQAEVTTNLCIVHGRAVFHDPVTMAASETNTGTANTRAEPLRHHSPGFYLTSASWD